MFFVSLKDVFDFVNTGNSESNSKHSLFDHFKRNLNMECNIPMFDVNTGILTSKGMNILIFIVRENTIS